MAKGVPRSEEFKWPPPTIKQLRELWAEGISASEIGRRIGVSKNAVIGKIARLGLERRPSPIKPRGPNHPNGTATAKRREQSLAVQEIVVASEVVKLARVTPPSVPTVRRFAECCWPIGEPGKPSFHFCNAPAVVPRPYCEEHAAIAYVRVRDRREDVA